MRTICGYVEKIKYRNQENGYTIFELVNDDEEMICVGHLPFVSEGDYLQVTGEEVVHRIYGEQLAVTSCETKQPEDSVAVERYLASGAIKGIGEALAARIVKQFGTETFRIMEEEPERLAEVKGISARIAREIGIQFEEKREIRQAMLYLQRFGISNHLAVKIYHEYGESMYRVLEENPYRLAEDIRGIGFQIADEIGHNMGVEHDSDYRIQSGILYTLSLAAGQGHMYLPEELLIRKATEILGVEQGKLERCLMEFSLDKTLVVKERGGEKIYYNASMYYKELSVARMLKDLNVNFNYDRDSLERQIEQIEEHQDIPELDELQQEAVRAAAGKGVLVVTGGPGTGKTTTINAMIQFLELQGMTILLAAPTGRAAKRMTETTGYEAQTIHRLLEIKVGGDSEEREGRFERNSEYPLEADAVIIDEMSMVDIQLMYALLSAITVGTHLILVGDVNQLPSIGPGNVLHDIIDSGCFPVIRLTKIFRQAAESDIIVNAHKIQEGQMIPMDNKSRDFFLLQRNQVNVIIQVMLQLVKQKLPGYVDATPFDIQVLTPMRKGELGVERLNEVLQRYLNPPDAGKKEMVYRNMFFREGDKVMHVKNNYQLVWQRKGYHGVTIEEGTGVFNGDCGTVKEIQEYDRSLVVEYEDNREVVYPFMGLDELELAYAVTIHKSQGSEYPAVVLPILSGPRMLMNRNLLYTAITRARKCVTIVGSSEMIASMIQNENEQKRYTSLAFHLQELV